MPVIVTGYGEAKQAGYCGTFPPFFSLMAVTVCRRSGKMESGAL